MLTMDELKNKIRGALGNPKAPWYGSDLIAWVGDYIEEAEKQLDNARDCLWGKKADYVKELEEENKRLKNFLNDWDGHDSSCGRNRKGFEGCDETMFNCNCGYQEAKTKALKGS